MMQNLKYTVLMSVYYKEKPEYLSLSIESMLNQTVKPDEFIIVKDGPLTTELDEVINNFVTAYPKMFNIIVNETNLGLGPALAKGIENSKNELIARMDSDDYVVSTRCEKQLEKFREDPKLGMVGSYEAEFVDTVDNVISIHRVPSENDEIERFMHRRCSVLHPTVLLRESPERQAAILWRDSPCKRVQGIARSIKPGRNEKHLRTVIQSETQVHDFSHLLCRATPKRTSEPDTPRHHQRTDANQDCRERQEVQVFPTVGKAAQRTKGLLPGIQTAKMAF